MAEPTSQTPRKITLETLAQCSRCGINLSFAGESIANTAEIVFLLCEKKEIVSKTVYKEPSTLAERADRFVGTLTPNEFKTILKTIAEDMETIEKAISTPEEETTPKNQTSPLSSQQ